MPSQVSALIYNLDEFRDAPASPKIGPVIAADAPPSKAQATLDDLFDGSAETQSFSAVARARFATLSTTLNAARFSDALDKDNAIMQLQGELPRSFKLKGWSDGALALIQALHHGLANRHGTAVDDSQFLRVFEAVNVLKVSPALRYERALDVIDTLEDSGLDIDPAEAELLQKALDV